jgi:hypothetical protein
MPNNAREIVARVWGCMFCPVTREIESYQQRILKDGSVLSGLEKAESVPLR